MRNDVGCAETGATVSSGTYGTLGAAAFFSTEREFNAIEAVGMNGTLTVSTEIAGAKPRERRMRIHIQDTGLGIPPENLLLSCARLPFLENSPPGDTARGLLERVKRVLLSLRACAAGRPANGFTRKLACACDSADAGIETVRTRLVELARGLVGRTHFNQALAALEALGLLDWSQQQGSWQALLARAAALKK